MDQLGYQGNSLAMRGKHQFVSGSQLLIAMRSSVSEGDAEAPSLQQSQVQLHQSDV